MEFRQRHQLAEVPRGAQGSALRAGFSLIEVLLVMGVLSILVVLSASGLVSARGKAALKKEASAAEVTIRQAQQRALSARDGQSWGVTCATDRLQTFSFTGGAETEAGQTVFAAAVRCQGSTEVRFQKLTGVPEADATFVLLAKGSAYRQIKVEQPGIINSTAL